MVLYRSARLLQGWGHAPNRTLYETLAVFVVYFVLKMFKNIDFYMKTRCTQGVRIFFQSKKVI